MSVLLPDWAPWAPLQPLPLDWAQAAGIELAVLRLDLLDPLISGNKWFKLSQHLAAAQNGRAAGVISLGGAHSNHLHALAAAGKRFAFQTVGLLRGHPQQTPTVSDLQAFGMQLHWLGYAGYRARHAADFWLPWQAHYPHFYALPEGGGGLPGALGCMSLVQQVREQLSVLGWADYDAWWLAAGTGTTLAGLLLGESTERPVHGALAVPADHGVEQQVQAILQAAERPVGRYHLHEACRGGFAQVDDALLDFMQATETASRIPLEPLYTAKALMALRQQVEAGYFARGSRLVFVHTGGLQGRLAALAKHTGVTRLN
ncbi:1-aminocyclopropane-1-carboxylate deaminase [Pseudomonas sp. HMWF032]|uniref:1-aminocyclopropane-1-carboxylate deaminase/D-cysteine desulfhydrase n=1 Tax=Pseudomonas sp. HMWF032 TaxID=2056866 RepID=UPI000D38DEB2|nr:pyridoxal-phosphate dependent enzyme [Pseudomonas sp. HMWF032]PTS82822.1 1-aminocyclopropane-1-carboxylate deaminase [Pseudomonas sp. HMWF032]PTT85956.1 1-aminocyclopropane-1-carboxylate deaminase [Pseudomonas sp. HMWF010]